MNLNESESENHYRRVNGFLRSEEAEAFGRAGRLVDRPYLPVGSWAAHAYPLVDPWERTGVPSTGRRVASSLVDQVGPYQAASLAVRTRTIAAWASAGLAGHSML